MTLHTSQIALARMLQALVLPLAAGYAQGVYTWRYVHEGSGVELTGTGIVLGAEIIQANKTLLAEEDRLRVVRFSLVVFDAAAKLELSTEEIRQIVEQDRLLAHYMPRLGLAIVASEDLHFGLSRMWEGHVASVGWRTSVFRSRTEAEAWILEVF